MKATTLSNRKVNGAANDERSTPQWAFERIEKAIFKYVNEARYAVTEEGRAEVDNLPMAYPPKFTFDVCATEWNTKCVHYYSLKKNGLVKPWKGYVWCNPPYSDPVPWLKRAVESTARGVTRETVVTMLLRGDVGTVWYHEYSQQAHHHIAIRPRIQFDKQSGGREASNPFPSIVLVFDSVINNSLKSHKTHYHNLNIKSV